MAPLIVFIHKIGS